MLNVQDPNSAVVENYSSIVDLLQLKIKGLSSSGAIILYNISISVLFTESKDIIERMISDNIEQLRSQLVPQQTEVEALKSQVTGKFVYLVSSKLRRISDVLLIHFLTF